MSLCQSAGDVETLLALEDADSVVVTCARADLGNFAGTYQRAGVRSGRRLSALWSVEADVTAPVCMNRVADQRPALSPNKQSATVQQLWHL